MLALSSLDLFLLGLIVNGIDTPYQFRARASISLGASLPALARLENAGLVTRQAKVQRNRQQFTTTKAGRHNLKRGLQEIMSEFTKKPPTDCESVLRISALCMLLGKKKDAATCLLSSAQSRMRRSRAIDTPKLQVNEVSLADLYAKWFRTIQRARIDAEGKILSDLAKHLPRSSSTPKSRHR